MAANQLVQARINGAIKEEAAAVLAAMGLTLSDAVRLLLTRVAREKALPFAPLIPNTVTIEAMKEARKGDMSRFDSVDALMDELRAPRLSAPASSNAITGVRPWGSTGCHWTLLWFPSWSPWLVTSPWNLGATTMH